jgi:hypothetical protein
VWTSVYSSAHRIQRGDQGSWLALRPRYGSPFLVLFAAKLLTQFFSLIPSQFQGTASWLVFGRKKCIRNYQKLENRTVSLLGSPTRASSAEARACCPARHADADASYMFIAEGFTNYLITEPGFAILINIRSPGCTGARRRTSEAHVATVPPCASEAQAHVGGARCLVLPGPSVSPS